MRVHLALLLLAWPLPPIPAEQAPPLESGTRVRVTVAGAESRPRIGTYEALRDNSLVLQADERSLSIPFATVQRFEVSHGRKLSVLGAVVGAVVGGAVGFFGVGCFANKDSYGVPCGGQDDTKFVIGGLVGGLAGGALGALIGRRERWESMDLDRLGAPPLQPQ